MEVNHIGPSSYDRNPIVGNSPVKPVGNSTSMRIPSTEAASSTGPISFNPKKAPVDDALLQQLDYILNLQATEIERELESLENSKKNNKLVDAILETESWGVWGHQFFDSTKDSVREGLEFLENVVPHQLISHLPHSSRLEHMGRLLSLSGAFISALDSGAQGLALICRSKILHRSEKLFKQVKKAYLENSPPFDSISQKKDQTKKTKENKISSLEDLNHVRQMLIEWETNINFEKESLAEEKKEFALNTASNILSIISVPFTYLPKEWILEHVKIAAEKVLSGILSGLEIIIAGWELHESKEKAEIFNQWSHAYQRWQERHLPRFKQTENGMQRENPLPSLASSVLSRQEHETALFNFFDKAKDLSEIRSYLKDFNIELDGAWQSKKEFLSHLQTNPIYRAKLVWRYIHVQNILAGLNAAIHKSHDLLEKRQAIINKKIFLLEPHFYTVEGKIKEVKKQIFIRDMQNLLWQHLQNPHCSPQVIRQQLQNWGFFQTPTGNNQKLLQAFKQFEMTASPQHKQNLIQEFSKWMEHSTALDNQFQAWYQTQSKKNLLRFYVDHQETIEQTTKNALKEMIHKKHEVENRFIQFKLTKSRIQFSLAAIALTVSLGLTILGLLTLPFGGAGLILLVISMGSTAISLGLLGASYYQAYQERPNTMKTLSIRFQAKMTWTKLRAAIQTYIHQAKEKKLLEVAKLLYKLQMSTSTDKYNEVEYHKALQDYKTAKQEFEENQKKTKEWLKRLKQLETHLAKKSWQDFAQHADLQINDNPAAFDTLRAFQKAIEACDLRLLSEETKTLLAVQLGLDLETLQSQIHKDPEAIKKTLEEFFILNDAELVSFIRKAHLKKRIHSMSGRVLKNSEVSFKIFNAHSSSGEKQHGS